MAITRYLKIGEESEFAEESEAPMETLDPESAELDPEEEDKLVYEGMSGVDRIAALGMYSTAGSITVPIDDRVAPFFFKWALGGYENSGDTHTFYTTTDPIMPSFTAKVGKDIMEHVFLGNVVETLELEVEDEWANLTVETVGARDQRDELDSSPDFSEGNVFAAPQIGLERDGEEVSADLEAFTLTIETEADAEESQGPGSRFPSQIFRGAMLVELEMEIGFADDSDLQLFWGGSDGPSSSTMEEAEYVIHVGDDMDIIFPRMIYMSATQPVEGRESITHTITARGLVDDSQDEESQGPVIVSVTNDKETYDLDELLDPGNGDNGGDNGDNGDSDDDDGDGDDDEE